MLNMAKCSFIQTLAVPVSSTVIAVEEGTPMVYFLENGELVVKPCAGASTEFFAGVAFTRATTPTTAPKVEEITIPATSPYTVTLGKTPLADPAAYILASGANARVVLTKDTTADATHYSKAGAVLTFHSSFAGRTVQVVYNYTLSHAEAVLKFNFDAFATVDLVTAPVIGLVKDGIIYTDKYDISVDWASWSGSTDITLGANGLFTIGGSGAVLDNAAVVSLPDTVDGFLGIHINAH